jgi:2-polyprenyl-3-methyl-5-hydroxy-6-metoxy-1,4-benzoquinol methylase
MRKIPNLKIINRDNWLIEQCQDKTILHLGCTDYPITESKIENQEILHLKLCKVARKVIGIDIDREGIEAMQHLMPDENFIVHSAEDLDNCEALHQYRFDTIVAADVIEHISNIGLFLNGVYNLLDANSRLLITTPQAFALKRFLAMIFLNYEYVHHDHIAYFSISTLSRILSRYKLEIEEVYAFQWENPTFKNKFANSLISPALWLSRGRLCDQFALVIKAIK